MHQKFQVSNTDSRLTIYDSPFTIRHSDTLLKIRQLSEKYEVKLVCFYCFLNMKYGLFRVDATSKKYQSCMYNRSEY